MNAQTADPKLLGTHLAKTKNKGAINYQLRFGGVGKELKKNAHAISMSKNTNVLVDGNE